MTHPEDPITEDSLVRSQHLCSKICQVNDITRTHVGLMEINTLAQQNLVQFINIITCSKQALVLPELDQVMMAHPLMHILILITYVYLHAMVGWQMLIELVFGH